MEEPPKEEDQADGNSSCSSSVDGVETYVLPQVLEEAGASTSIEESGDEDTLTDPRHQTSDLDTTTSSTNSPQLRKGDDTPSSCSSRKPLLPPKTKKDMSPGCSVTLRRKKVVPQPATYVKPGFGYDSPRMGPTPKASTSTVKKSAAFPQAGKDHSYVNTIEMGGTRITFATTSVIGYDTRLDRPPSPTTPDFVRAREIGDHGFISLPGPFESSRHTIATGASGRIIGYSTPPDKPPPVKPRPGFDKPAETVSVQVHSTPTKPVGNGTRNVVPTPPPDYASGNGEPSQATPATGTIRKKTLPGSHHYVNTDPNTGNPLGMPHAPAPHYVNTDPITGAPLGKPPSPTPPPVPPHGRPVTPLASTSAAARLTGQAASPSSMNGNVSTRASSSTTRAPANQVAPQQSTASQPSQLQEVITEAPRNEQAPPTPRRGSVLMQRIRRVDHYVVEYCPKKPVYGYFFLLRVMGLEPLFEVYDSVQYRILKGILNKIYLLLIVALLITGYYLQFITCFRRDIGFSNKDENVTRTGKGPGRCTYNLKTGKLKFCRPTKPFQPTSLDQIICSENFAYIVVMSAVLHLFGFLYAVYLYRKKDAGEILSRLIAKVCVEVSIGHSEAFEVKMWWRVRSRMWVGLSLLVISLSCLAMEFAVGNVHLSESYVKDKNSSFNAGHAGIFSALFFTVVFQDGIQLLILITYVIHCCLICGYAELVRKRIDNDLQNLYRRMPEVVDLGEFMAFVNNRLSVPVAALLLMDGLFAASGVTEMIEYGGHLSVAATMVRIFVVLFWTCFVIPPLAQAAKIVTCCYKMRHRVMTLRTRVLEIPGLVATQVNQLNTFIADTPLTPKIMNAPVKRLLLCIAPVLILIFGWYGFVARK